MYFNFANTFSNKVNYSQFQKPLYHLFTTNELRTVHPKNITYYCIQTQPHSYLILKKYQIQSNSVFILHIKVTQTLGLSWFFFFPQIIWAQLWIIKTLNSNTWKGFAAIWVIRLCFIPFCTQAFVGSIGIDALLATGKSRWTFINIHTRFAIILQQESRPAFALGKKSKYIHF